MDRIQNCGSIPTPKSSVFVGGLASHTPTGTPPPGPRCFWIESSILLVSVWIGFVKMSHIFFSQVPSSQEHKLGEHNSPKTQEHKSPFQNIVHLLRHFFLHIWSVKTLGIYEQNRSQLKKYKSQKSENRFFIRFRTLRNNLDKKMETALYEEGGEVCNCISLTRTGPIF